MTTIPSKIVKTTIDGLGDIEISVLQIGKEWHLQQLEEFITKTGERFRIIMMQKPEINSALYLQYAIQEFVKHIQSIGKEQAANEIRSHFKNWVFSLNGNLKTVIENGRTSANNSDTTGDVKTRGTSSDRVEALRNW